MAKYKRIAFTIPEEQWKALSALAGTFGVAPEEVIRESLPDDAVVGLFFQCRVYEPELTWDEVARAGRDAMGERLRNAYLQGLQKHLTRLGMSLASSAEEAETARKRVLDELKADEDRPLQHQIARAEEDSVYLGRLYEAWKHAQSGAAGYAIAQVDVEGDPAGPCKAWAVLKDRQIV